MTTQKQNKTVEPIVVGEEEIEKTEVLGTLWFNVSKKGTEYVEGNIGDIRVYGFINEVEIKKGPRSGTKARIIKLFKKSE